MFAIDDIAIIIKISNPVKAASTLPKALEQNISIARMPGVIMTIPKAVIEILDD